MPFFTDNKTSVFFLLIALLAIIFISYYPSTLVPFYLDDNDSIVTSTIVQAQSLDALFNSYLNRRFVGYASFWLNYQLHELDLFGYHIVNIVIHIFNTILVYILSLMLLQSFPGKGIESGKNLKNDNKLWALAIAALWGLHPLNSQTVIYVVQRLALFVSFFMLLSVITYIKLRQTKSLPHAVGWGTLLVAFIVLGFFSKQNFVAIFLFLIAWELFTGSVRVVKYLRFLAIFGVLFVTFSAPFLIEFWEILDQFTRDPGATTRTTYFYTQMIVLWDYIGRYFAPFNLQLNIWVDSKESFEPIVALSMLFHVLLIVFAYKLRHKAPLFFIGVLFFYTSHSIESFIIPIKDFAFEHRTYVGNIGLSLFVVACVKYFVDNPPFKIERKKVTYAFSFGFVAILMISGFQVYKRSEQWQDPLAFYAVEVELAPEHFRTNSSYGSELLKNGRYEEAEIYLKKSIDISASNGTLTAAAINSYMMLMYQQGKYQQAAPIVMMGLKHIRYPIPRSMLLSNLAVGYIYMGFCDFALGLLDTALKLNPANSDAFNNRAYCLQKMNKEQN